MNPDLDRLKLKRKQKVLSSLLNKQLDKQVINYTKRFRGRIPDDNLEEIKNIHCRLCGNILGWQDGNINKGICKYCFDSILKDLIRLKIPINSKVHCPNCHSHIKACKCETKKAMDKLKE